MMPQRACLDSGNGLRQFILETLSQPRRDLIVIIESLTRILQCVFMKANIHCLLEA